MKHVMKALSGEVIDVAPHLTCIGLSKTVVRELLHHYKQLGIKRLVVLRGDFLEGTTLIHEDFEDVNEIVAYIRKLMDNYFYIEVVGYPGFYPESENVMDALKNF